MKRLAISRMVLALCVSAASTAAFAQVAPLWPTPAKTQNTPVICSDKTTCGNFAGKATASYSDPVKTFVGRYLDSQATQDFQSAFRTARAGDGSTASPDILVNPVKNRMYMRIGSGLFAYNLDRFFSRLSGGEALAPISSVGVRVSAGNRFGGAMESIFTNDALFYAEASGWSCPAQDGQDRLFGYDFDDRGYVYMAYSLFGWGIARDDYGSGGGLMPSVSQWMPSLSTDLTPTGTIISVKASTGYYVLVTQSGNEVRSHVFNVTNAAAPAQMPDHPRAYVSVARLSNGNIGLVSAAGGFYVYTPDALVQNSQPIFTSTAPGNAKYISVDTDGTNFYLTSSLNGKAGLSAITPAGSTFRETATATNNFYSFAPHGRFGAGFFTVTGNESGAWTLRLYKISGTTFTEVPTGDYFSQYYSSRGDFAHYNSANANIAEALVVKNSNKYYMIVAAKGLGDVYEIKGSDSISGLLRRAGETVNPNAQSPVGSGPFYGDKFTFSSSTSAATASNVTWNFGNPESGDNTAGSITGADVTHQFSGLTVGSLSATRSVTVTSATDSSITDTVSVTLNAPTARVGLLGSTALMTSGQTLVGSDQFTDASDGSVEGHYADWVIDSTTTKAIPTQTVPVGNCGAHTLNFNAHYGPYSGTGASLIFSTTNYQSAVSNVSYTVVPFVAAIAAPTADATTVTFRSASRASASASDLPLGSSTSFTYTWELLKSDGTVSTAVPALTGTSTIAAIPSFAVAKSVFSTPGLKVRLRLDATVVSLGNPCQNFASNSATTAALNGPDPQIVTSGCANIGSPCSFSVRSASGASMTDWTYNWSTTGASTVGGGATATYTPTISVAGNYTVSVSVANSVGSSNVQTSIAPAAPVCASAPATNNMAIGYSGATSGCFAADMSCTAGETIQFSISQSGYVPASCDTFLWSFGDGTTSTAQRPTHTYSGNGTYVLSLQVVGGLGQATVTSSLKVGSVATGGGGNTGGGNTGGGNTGGGNTGGGGTTTCGDLGGVSIDFNTPDLGCSLNGGGCKTNQSITFTTAVGFSGYNFGCGSHTFAWTFDDGATSNVQSPQHIFTTGGNHLVTLRITNPSGQSTNLQSVISISGGGACATMTANNLVLNYSDITSACNQYSTTPCPVGQPLTFSVTTFGYSFACAPHNFTWDFGDGKSGSGQSTPHTYANSGTYNVKVTIDNGSQQFPMTATVSVGGTSARTIPTVDFTTQILPALPGMFVFTPTATPSGVVTKWVWTFGDGSTTTTTGTSAQPQPHTFSSVGNFTVTLTTFDQFGSFPPVSHQVTNGSVRARATRH